MEPLELSPALLQPQVTVVAILGELLATAPSRDEEMLLSMSARCLYWDLVDFTRELRENLSSTGGIWWCSLVIYSGNCSYTSLSRALAVYKSTPRPPWDNVTSVVGNWKWSVSGLLDRWAQLARKATQLRNTCREVATKADDMVATTWARELQGKAARDGTAQESMVELGQALGREEGAEVVARVRRDARVAANWATMATTVTQRAEAALGLLERLVAACDKATAFPRELQRLLRDIEASVKGTNEASPNVPEDLVAKVAVAEQLWEANACLAKDHLLGTVEDIIQFYINDDPASPSACGVAERCQRVIEDIPRLIQTPERRQSIPKVSPVSMELQELSPALLQPQVAVVAIVGELLATLPRRAEMMLLPVSPLRLYSELEKFTRELRSTLYSIDDTWWHRNVTTNEDDPPTSLSQALATYQSAPWTTENPVAMAADEWQSMAIRLEVSWECLARRATWLRNTCREVVTEAANMVPTATTRARELQHKAACDGTAQENVVELGQALGREEGAEVVAGFEAPVRRDARVAVSWAARDSMVRQRVEVTLGLLERLAAACDAATAFPRELQHLLEGIRAAMEETNEASPDIPEDLVAKVAMAKRMWEANARLVKDHLVGTVPDTIKFLFNGGPTSPSACEVAERCQRATEDIPRLLQPLESPQSIPKVSPVIMELQELSPALLQPQVTVVAILGELLATLPSRDKVILLGSAVSLYRDLEEFTRRIRVTMYFTDDTWFCHNVTSYDDNTPTSNDDAPNSLSQALAAYKSTSGTRRNHVIMAASKWQELVAALVDRWAELSKNATKLRNTCRDVATKADDMATIIQARRLQDKAAHYGSAQKNVVELGLALGRQEGAKVVAGHESWVRRDARVAASWATTATMLRQRLEAALGLLERLVAACHEATAFPRELQWRLRDIEASVKGTNEASPAVPEDLVAKVAEAERLWEASHHLAKDHLLGTLQDIIDFYFDGDPTSPSGVAERCQRAIEDIPRLLRPLERPQGVPKVSPVSMELQELSPALLQPQVTVVATLGMLLATLPRRDEMKVMSALHLYWDLVDFTKELWVTLYRIDDTWWHHYVTSHDDDPVTSLSQALAANESNPWTPRNHVTMAASKWQRSVTVLLEGWARLARKATKLHNTRRRVATEAESMVATATDWARLPQTVAHLDGTAQENIEELHLPLFREEWAKVVAGHEDRVRRDARVAASRVTTATMERQRLEAALGLLERLVAACHEATAFPRELQHRAGDIVATLKGTNEASPNVPEDLVAKVAVAERLWEANARLAKDHLLGTLQDTIKFLFTGGPTSPRGVVERCQRAIEDIPRLLQHLERPQSVPKLFPVSMELQELRQGGEGTAVGQGGGRGDSRGGRGLEELRGEGQGMAEGTRG
ncbi:uncharacterized protein LOC135286326 [Passer domesticus]|uniref:uncharacterized protein LOC135286326 n=1 Tax=Passer domesticus TaxID=48849 RepID=UPI0030FE1223